MENAHGTLMETPGANVEHATNLMNLTRSLLAHREPKQKGELRAQAAHQLHIFVFKLDSSNWERNDNLKQATS